MPTQVRRQIARILSDKRHRTRYLEALTCLAVVVVLGVAAALIQQGHAAVTTVQVLSCPVDHAVAHTHDASCYDTAGTPVCPLPERAPHTHDDSCYSEELVLTCGLAEGDTHEHDASCYEVIRSLTCGQDELTETHTHGPGCFTTVTTDDGTPADEAMLPSSSEEAPSTQTFRHTFEDDDHNLLLQVDVVAPAGALPENATMSAQWIDPAQMADDEASAVDAAISQKVDGQVLDLQAVDISFLDAAGAEVEPAQDVSVTFTSPLLATDDQPVIVHVEDDQQMQQRAAQTKDEDPQRQADVIDPLADRELERRNVSLADDQLCFDSDQFSTYVLATTSLSKTMQASDGSTVTVTVDAPAAAGIPQDAELQVHEISPSSSDWQDYSDQAAEALDAGTIQQARFFDITIVDEQGASIQPAQPVHVEVSLADAPSKANASVLHFAQDGPEVLPAAEADGTATFDAAGFSVYGVVYTVDFHYDVDGKTFSYGIVGGGFTSLRELVGLFGITDDPVAFVKDIKSVTFSNPSLLSATKVKTDTTVATIKRDLGLDCTYSSELTATQIDEINATKVTAPDWALISLRPFDSTETLTITMNDGEQFAIRLTDDQENPWGLGGKTFVIVGSKNGSYALTSATSSGNAGCLAATNTNTINSNNAPDNVKWTFEYTGTGKEFLLRSQNGTYLGILEGYVTQFSTREEALANPIVVAFDNSTGKYSLRAKNNNQGLNIYNANEGFGRWGYSANNADFWFDLRNPNDVGKPGTIATADTRSDGIVINLFDYGPDSLDKEGNTVDNTTNEGINQGHDLKFVSHGTVGTGINHYTGTDYGYRAMQGIVQPELVNGYPVLTNHTEQNGSLRYLFDPKMTNVAGKTVYPDVNHLFTKDEKGYYEYDSNANYAYYDQATRDFILYANSFNEEGTVKNEKVGFFPFNDYDSYYNCIHGGQPNDESGFGYYDPHWVKEGWSGYHVGLDKLGHYNHHFGVSLEADFVITKDGKNNGEDISFSFSGDDDMWVFVDGVLVLDIGGIHNPVSGSINFRTGDVTVSGKTTVAVAGAKAGPTSLREAFSRVTGKDWDDTPFSTHKLQVFYMERGGMYSNCKMGFNLPLYKTLSLSKRLNGLSDAERAKYQNEEFKYEVYVNDELYNGNDTIRMNAAGEVIEEGFEIRNGQVSIKDGETVTIMGLKRTDSFYAAEEKSLNMEQYEVPHAERFYHLAGDSNVHEEEIALTEDQTHGAPTTVKDWKTETYEVEDTEKVTFNNTLKEKDLEVEKIWNDELDHTGDPVTFRVDAKAYGSDGDVSDYVVDALKASSASTTNDRTFTLDSEHGWKTTIEHLPLVTSSNTEGKRIIYSINERAIEGYSTKVREVIPDTCNIDAMKLWPDDAEHTEVITVKLRNKAGQYYAGEKNGKAQFTNDGVSYQLTPGNGYTCRFHHVPISDDPDAYELVEIGDTDQNTKGLVTYVREIISCEIVNTPLTGDDPNLPSAQVEYHKRIDALRDGATNPDSAHAGEDLTDLYRLYLDYKVNSVQDPNGVDLLFIIDHSGSMNNEDYGGNPYRAPAVMNALNGDDGVIAQFMSLNDNNRWAAVGFLGPSGFNYRMNFLNPMAPWRPVFDNSYAGWNDSEVLSPGGDDHIWQDEPSDIALPNDGATMLTNYVAGLWRAEQFLGQQDILEDGRKKVIVFISDGIPTLYIDCDGTLADAGNRNGSYYYPDGGGGCPDETLDQFGNFVTDMQGFGYEFGKDAEFYAVGFGNSIQAVEGQNLLKGMVAAAYGESRDENFMVVKDWTASYNAAEKMKQVLAGIVGTSEHFNKLVIQDDLSKYVDLYGLAEAGTNQTAILRAAQAKVTMTDPADATRTITLYENGALTSDNRTSEGVQILQSVSYDASSKKVTATFNPDYEAQPGVTYTLSFDVKTTQVAYDHYAAGGYDFLPSGKVVTGEEDTDFLGTTPPNATSVDKEGFRSNDEATVTYLHDDKPQEKEYPHPVVQVSACDFSFSKVWLGMDANLSDLKADDLQAWKAGDTINVTLKRRAAGASKDDASFALTYEIDDGDGPFQPTNAGLSAADKTTYQLVKTVKGNVTTFALGKVLKEADASGKAYTYYVEETAAGPGLYVTHYGTVDGQTVTRQADASFAQDGQVVINQESSGTELPAAGGRGVVGVVATGVALVAVGALLALRERPRAMR